MKFASVLAGGRPTWGVVDGDAFIDMGDTAPDLRTAIAHGLPRQPHAGAPRHALTDVTLLPAIPNPDKIICVGLNYESHRRETGRDVVGNPTLFLRLANSQIGHGQPILRPHVSQALDFEGELAVIIGRGGRYIAEADAFDHVAGYACYNDATLRDWQRHTSQFTPGKNFAATGALGPYLVTSDEVGDIEALRLTTRLNGAVVQEAGLDQLIFSIPRVIAYCSSFTRLEPGDVIATGTPGGVGFMREPPLFMKPGDTVEVDIPGVGRLVNAVAEEPRAA